MSIKHPERLKNIKDSREKEITKLELVDYSTHQELQGLVEIDHRHNLPDGLESFEDFELAA